ncbi:FkbM family methyltransferase [Pedobacter zeae]|uniref:FkbM family methyltransferase n=1 Tax=Pedobacter zeae TaxID=1737356 RepID=A0A7W6K9V8_9SPHI|nr:FkbM family methyltransferase [Pedobacter zeae]MBB4107787.1 FkbM family methyltransferase [Pedobacter zeae]GGG97054.1 hypothetical protein GCM10007422_08670 [Pedobacter zeae]
MKIIKRTFGFIHTHPLAKKHLIKAYLRFITWQIKTRFNPSLQPVKFLHHICFFAKQKLTGITGNIYTGLHEFNEMGFLLHFLNEGDVFFDIGANVGSYTLLASGICRAKTISFEPIPETFSILRQNIALNGLELLVQTENKGVGSKSESIRFSHTEDTTNHAIASDEKIESSVLVPIVSLDECFADKGPILIKIDVEGFESEVLNGADLLLSDQSLKAVIIELNGSGGRYGYDEHEIHLKLLAYGFKNYTYNPFKRELNTIGLKSDNSIYIRDIEFTKERVERAESFIVFNEVI